MTRTQAVKSLPARLHLAGRCVRDELLHMYTGSLPWKPHRTRQVAVSGKSRDTLTQAVKSLPARPHSAGRRFREELRHTFTGGQIPAGQTTLGRSPCQGRAATYVHRRSNPCRPDRTRQVAVSGRSRDTVTHAGGQIPAGQTALSRSPCQGGAATHIHRRSNPCWPDRTQQVTVSGKSRDTRSQAVKSLPARPHSAGRRVREEPRHMFTGGQIPAGQTALGWSPCQGGGATHVHRRSNLCWPGRTRQVAVSGRSRDTRTQAVKSLPAKPHSAGCRVREEPRHTYTGSQIPASQTALCWSPCQGGAATQIHMWPTLLARSHSLKYCKLTSLDASSSKELYITTTTLAERNGQRKRIVRQTKESSTITGATYYGLFLSQMPFSPLMKNTAHFSFFELSPSVEGDRDVVCDPPLYGRLTSPSCLH